MCHIYATFIPTKFNIITYIVQLFKPQDINNNKGLHMIIYHYKHINNLIIE